MPPFDGIYFEKVNKIALVPSDMQLATATTDTAGRFAVSLQDLAQPGSVEVRVVYSGSDWLRSTASIFLW